MLLFNAFKYEIAESVAQVLAAADPTFNVQVEIENIYQQLTIPPEFTLGQAALPCFTFAKNLKQAPQKIAADLAEKLNAKDKKLIAKVESVNAYLNFHCNFPNVAQKFAQMLQSKTFFKQKLIKNPEKIVIEYSQPNTHKAMHVGHLRCLVLGDALSNLLEYAGHTVVRATYPGDMGTHVAKVIWYLNTLKKQDFPTENQADWLGQMYVNADEAVKASLGTAQEAQVKEEIGKIVREINTHQGKNYELWYETREWSLAELRRVYDWLNTKFDVWYYESECEEPGRELVKQQYSKGFFVEDAGAIGIDLSAWKLGFALYLKSNGNSLYLTKDLDLITRKFSDAAVTKSIVVVDARQKLHFQQLFKTAELMGYPQAAKSMHLSYETVNTADGKAFSSRERNGVGLMDLAKKMEDKVTSDYLERYRQTWSAAEIELTAKNVSIGALKYGMLRVDNNTQINFSLDEWLRLDGETGPYLQYVHARCHSILEKFPMDAKQRNFQFVLPVEEELLFILLRFNDCAGQAAQQNRPSIMANYLYDVAKSFNRFYEECPIRDAALDVKENRLFLVESTSQIIAQGLKLLGICAPNRM